VTFMCRISILHGRLGASLEVRIDTVI
jgi:hypothetical protein